VLDFPLQGAAIFTLPPELKIAPTDELLSRLEKLLGRGAVSLA
jgi:hypothetical protein